MKNFWNGILLHNTRKETLYLFAFCIMRGPYNLCMDPSRHNIIVWK